jgi:hypothetical protein
MDSGETNPCLSPCPLTGVIALCKMTMKTIVLHLALIKTVDSLRWSKLSIVGDSQQLYLLCSCSAARKIRAVITSGRGIRRLVTLCGTITQLVSENDHRLPTSESEDEDDSDEDGSPEMKEGVQR